MKRIIFIAIVWLSLFSAPTLANQCLNYLNFVQGSCGSYTYEPITAHFLDLQGVEQSVTVHRIYDSANQVVQADLDFKVNCPGGCGTNREQAITSALWAFREAYLRDKLYIARFLSSNKCNEIDCIDANDDEKSSRAVRYYSVSSSGFKAYDLAVKESRNEAEFRQKIVTQQQALMKIVMPINDQDYRICVITGGSCKEINGHISITNDNARVDLANNFSVKFNSRLDSWLDTWLAGEYLMRCDQHVACEMDGNCTIKKNCSAL